MKKWYIEIIRKLGYVGSEYYELWVPGGISTVSEPEDVKIIDQIIKYCDKWNLDRANYLSWHLNEYGWTTAGLD